MTPSVRQSGSVHAGSVVVLASPLENLSWWGGAATCGADRLPVVPVDVGDQSPYGTTWVARSAQVLHTTRPRGPLLLVGHGTAGPLLPAVSRTQRAAGRHIAGYVFADATLPRPGRPTHLDLLRAADSDAADAAHHRLHSENPIWPPAATHPADHEFWTTPLPMATDWPDAPCVYIRTTNQPPGVGDTEFWARSAAARGWQVHAGSDIAALVAEVLHTG